MFGAIIVSPHEGMPPAKDFVLVQNEYYLAPAANGIHASDYPKMLTTFPDIVAFNGRPNQYMKDPIKVKVGDRVRFWVVSAGPSHQCNFHVVGEQFDNVYLGALPGNSDSRCPDVHRSAGRRHGVRARMRRSGRISVRESRLRPRANRGDRISRGRGLRGELGGELVQNKLTLRASRSLCSSSSPHTRAPIPVRVRRRCSALRCRHRRVERQVLFGGPH